jgi:polysaccharide export outer membrane protein
MLLMTCLRPSMAPLLACIALLAAGGVAAQETRTPPRTSAGYSTSIAAAPVATDAVPAASLAPLGSPVARDYRIGPEDLLEIQVFGVDQLARTVRVNMRGYVSLPLIGAVEVQGLTAQEAEARIVAKLGESYLQDPQVSLFIKEFTVQRVTIEGAVNRPGIYPIRGPTSLLQALAFAGGQGSLSDMTQVMLFRSDGKGQRETQVHDVERIRKGELPDPAVLNDDLIVVKRDPTRVMLKDSVFTDVLDLLNPFK